MIKSPSVDVILLAAILAAQGLNPPLRGDDSTVPDDTPGTSTDIDSPTVEREILRQRGPAPMAELEFMSAFLSGNDWYWDPLHDTPDSQQMSLEEYLGKVSLPEVPGEKSERHEAAAAELDELGLVVDEVGDLSDGRSGVAVETPFFGIDADELRRNALPLLSDLANVVYLNSFSVTLGPGDSAHLTDLTELRVLNVTFSRCTDSDLQNLAQLKKVEYLGLRVEEASPAGVLEMVTALPNLKNLTLNASQLGLTSSQVRELRRERPGLNLRLR